MFLAVDRNYRMTYVNMVAKLRVASSEQRSSVVSQSRVCAYIALNNQGMCVLGYC
jgi:hypothetical protein